MNGKTELVTALVAGPTSGAQTNSRAGFWMAVQSRLGVLRGCLGGLAAVALVTFIALQLHLNLSTSGSLYFLIVVMVSVIWGFWEASFTSLIAVVCLNYFFVPPVFTWTVSDPQNWVALATFELAALTVSRLSTRAQDRARAEARQRMEVQKLYELSRRREACRLRNARYPATSLRRARFLLHHRRPAVLCSRRAHLLAER